MNVAHTKVTIPLECDGRKYHITVQIENPGNPNPVYWAHGEGYTNPMESPCGMGDTVEEAILMFLEQIGQPREFFEYNPNYPQ